MQGREEAGKYLLQGLLYLWGRLVEANANIITRRDRTASTQHNCSVAALLPIFSSKRDGCRHCRCEHRRDWCVGEHLPSYWNDQLSKLRKQLTYPGIGSHDHPLCRESAA